MAATKKWGRENRVRISLKFYYSFDRVEGVGLLVNISYSGARIEDISTRPPEIGTPIVLCVYLEPPLGSGEVTPFELTGHVIQHSSTGFAIEYEHNFDPWARRMVDDAAAIIAGPR